jgi:hypothetical protein
MGKYRGADGWIHDDSVDKPRRYENKENLNASPKKESNPDPNVGPRSKCPNCDLTHTWRKLEGYCTRCGWGKVESTGVDSDTTGGCCAFAALCLICPLVAGGMGYAFMGFGGLLAGGGLGIAFPVSVLVYAVTSGAKSGGGE